MARIQYRLECTDPTGTRCEVIYPSEESGLEYGEQIGEPTGLKAVLVFNVDRYASELDAAEQSNPVQLNSLLLLKRSPLNAPDWTTAAVEFRGKIATKPIRSAANGKTIVQFGALSKMAVLETQDASIGGDPFASAVTPTVILTQVNLERVENQTGGADALPTYAWFPEYGSGAHEPTNLAGIETTLDTTINNSVTEIIGDIDHHGFAASGFLLIDEGGTEEVVWYDGYEPTAAGDKYRFLFVRRGALGTTAVIHLAGVTLKQLRPYTFSPMSGILLEKHQDGTHGTDWLPMGQSEYSVNPNEGMFAVSFNILTFEGAFGPYDALRATFGVLKSDAAGAVNAKARIIEILEETQANGGPGWTSGVDFGVDANLERLVYPRHLLPGKITRRDAIQDILRDGGLTGGENGVDAASMIDDAENDLLLIGLIQQKADDVAPDYRVAGTRSHSQEYKLTEVATGIRGYYSTPEGNKISAVDRVWHPEVGDIIGDGTGGGIVDQEVGAIIWQDEETGTGTWDQNEYTGTGTAHGVERMFDGLETTGWGLRTGKPGDTNEHPGVADALVGWCPIPGGATTGTPSTVTLDSVSIVLDARLTNNTVGPFNFVLMGITDMTVTAGVPTWSAADEVFISGSLQVQFSNTYPVETTSWTNLANFGSVKLEASDIGIPIKGYICRWIGAATRKNASDGNTARYMQIKTLDIRGKSEETVLVQLTDTDGLGSLFYYRPETYAKLRDANGGEPRVKPFSIGLASKQSAISLSLLELKRRLRLAGDYVVECVDLPFAGLPVCGRDTIEVIDFMQWVDREYVVAPIRGVALARNVKVTARGGERATFVIRDFRGPIIQ